MRSDGSGSAKRSMNPDANQNKTVNTNYLGNAVKLIKYARIVEIRILIIACISR
jgi:hypothetical protein